MKEKHYAIRLSMILAMVFSLAAQNCKKDNPAEAPLIDILVSTGLLINQADYYAKLYYLDPLIAADSKNVLLISEATANNVTSGNKKLILIHGWDFNDRSDNYTYPFPLDLRKRVLQGNWSDFIDSKNANGTQGADATFGNIILAGYDVYAFDYLTSEGVDANGVRLRAKMDALFSGEPAATVVIFAHSMGGLVSRFAVYEGSAPAYIKQVITAGTPNHGSPWASSQFQGDHAALGVLASYLTNTAGGQDLRWDNFDSSLAGATNPKLTAINANTARDNLFYAYYASYTGTSIVSPSAGGELTLLPACNILHGTAAFAPSDCIVPKQSASFSDHTLAGTADVGGYTHLDIKLGTEAIRNSFYTQLTTVLP